MPAPDMRPPGPPPVDPVVAAPGRPRQPRKKTGRRIGWKRGILLGVVAVLAILTVWVYLGYRSFSNEVAKANTRMDKKTLAALAPAAACSSTARTRW